MIRRKKPLRKSALVRRPRKPKPGDDPDYKAWIRRLPCVACWSDSWRVEIARENRVSLGGRLLDVLRRKNTMSWHSECAHIGFSTSRRGLAQKFPDRETAPLCRGHHAELHKTTPNSFFAGLGISRDELLCWLNSWFGKAGLG